MRSTWNSVIERGDVGAVGNGYLTDYDPSTGDVLAEVSRADHRDIDRAVIAAERAFPAWRRSRPAARATTLFAIATALRARRDEFATLETLDTGKPLSLAKADVDMAARYFEFFAGACDKFNGDVIPLGEQYLAYSEHEPYGVVGIILPWNAPLQQAARSIAPALCVANTLVVKPAEDTPLTCLLLAELALDCGLPPGVLNVVPGTGEEAGAPLVADNRVRRVMFTGSVEVGRLIAEQAGRRLAPVGLELGGKSPNIIFEDADIPSAVAGSVHAITYNAGQACSAGSRLLVHSAVYDETLGRLQKAMADLTVGPGMEDPDIGPIVTREQYDRINGYLAAARQAGSKVALGSEPAVLRRYPKGNYVAPTIFEADNTSRIACEEVFGPVLVVMPFDSTAQAVAMANDTDYGLVAGVWTQNFSRAHAVARRLDAGQVFINEWFAGGVETPFGGYKNSGLGREKGLEALRHYTQVKTVIARISDHDLAGDEPESGA